MAQTSTSTKAEAPAPVDLTGTNAADLIARFTAAKAAIKVLEGQKAEAEAALRAMLGDSTVGVVNGVERVRIQFRNNSKIDRKALEAGWPEAFAATLVQSSYTVLDAK